MIIFDLLFFEFIVYFYKISNSLWLNKLKKQKFNNRLKILKRH